MKLMQIVIATSTIAEMHVQNYSAVMVAENSTQNQLLTLNILGIHFGSDESLKIY